MPPAAGESGADRGWTSRYRAVLRCPCAVPRRQHELWSVTARSGDPLWSPMPRRGITASPTARFIIEHELVNGDCGSVPLHFVALHSATGGDKPPPLRQPGAGTSRRCHGDSPAGTSRRCHGDSPAGTSRRRYGDPPWGQAAAATAIRHGDKPPPLRGRPVVAAIPCGRRWPGGP
jgi:hypothetical protein